ncbi:hypothetical protein PVAND_002318 [Polypedilum vanderplanki]|uniref:Uncharacterized protein n=1 Tax=Polypedilum vanderplanki TaxID=319348 RepID=A0A9J6BR83_POLVA|nr:hypothetical protein PVAND_002318 [Polypedilum vanderplanki]
MNWKLFLIASILVFDVSGRPADEIQSEPSSSIETKSAAKLVDEITNLTEKTTTLIQPQTTKSVEAVTKKTTEKIIPTEAATSTKASHNPTTTRYLHLIQPSQNLQTTKSTNIIQKKKYANDYSNLITKHTLLNNKRFLNNTASNITVFNKEFVISSDSSSSINNANKISLNNNSLIIKSTTESNEVPSLPSFATVSSAVNSNSSSKPLLFIDANDFPLATFVDPTTSTTKRAFVALNNNPIASWPTSSHIEEAKATPKSIRKKPVIHKIISKWSDNPNEVFNFHGDRPMISSQHAHITELKNQLTQSAFNQQNSVISFDNLPTIIGQQLIHQQQQIPSFETSIIPLSSTSAIPAVNDLILLKKKPISNNIDEELLDRCREVRIKLGTSIDGKIDSKELIECKGLNIHIDNKIDNTNKQAFAPINDYDIPTNDKFEDAPTEELYDSSLIEVDSESVHNQHEIQKEHKKKKKSNKKHKTDKQVEEEDGTEVEEETTTTEMSSMMMTVVTMMAIFNPLNFGVWGLLLAPVAAITLGGIVLAMYHFTKSNHHDHQQIWQMPMIQPWIKPQEIVVKNKIKHSPIPIKITHHHKHISAPQKMVSSSHHQPVIEYAPPWHSSSGSSNLKNSYGEPPVDSYYPSAPSDGPYRRKASMSKQQHRRKNQRPSNPFRYKLL